MDNKEQLIKLIEKLKVHDHLCLIYSSKEEEFAAVVPFMRIGLERGERCVYIADDNTVIEVLDVMRKSGIDIDAYIRSGAFVIVTKKDAYLKQGYFDPDLMINFLKQSTDEAKKAGFPVLRVTGEMTWALGGVGIERVIEYESKLNYFFPNNDVLVICQYNSNRFGPEVILEVIETHPLVIYNYSVGKNFYYIPPDEFLKPGQEKKKVERLLKNIFDRTKGESLKNDALEALGARIRQQEVIANLGQFAMKGVELQELFDEAVKQIAKALKVEFCKVLEVLPDKAVAVLRAGAGWEEGSVGRVTVGIGLESQAGFTLQSKEPVIVKDLRTESRFHGPALLHDHNVVSGMSVIIGTPEKPFGVLGAHTTCLRTFTKQDIDFLKSAANLLADAVWRKQAEEGLRAAALYVRNLIEASLDPLVTIDLSGKITDVNKATENATGVSRERLIGSDFADYFTNPEDAREGYSQVFSHGVVRDYPLTIRHVSGRTMDVLYNASVYKDEEGNGQGVFAAARDITESKRAERLVRHLSDVLQTVNDIDRLMLYEHDASRLMTEACEILLRTRGYVLAWVGTIEEGHKRVIPMARAGKKTDYLDEVTITWDDSDTGRGPTGTAIRTHQMQVCRDMATDPNFAPWREAALARGFASSAVLPMIHGGKVFGVLSVYSNKTGFFDEEELELLTGLVDDLAYALHNIEIESERKKIEQMKDVLIRDVSHSLKTPIALAKMGVNMLDRGLEGADAKRISEAKQIVRDNIEIAHRDITSILDLYVMEQGKKPGRKEPVSLGKIVKGITEGLRYIVEQKKLGIKIDVPEDADKTLANGKEIKMLLFNIIGNAVKFTDSGSVSVSARSAGKMVEITVVDTGCGIAGEEKNKLFQRFYQRHASIDGVGLGLTICKEIVGRHNGTIEVKSEGVGKGTTVTIRLPRD